MKFILTRELGKLTRWLRILGFDAIYFRSDNLSTLVIEVLREERILLTRRRHTSDILQKKTVVIEANELNEQLKEVLDKLKINLDKELMFTRCTICNEILTSVRKEEIKEEVPPYVYETQKEFRKCFSCKRVYWQGTHWGNVNKVIAKITGGSLKKS